MVGTFGRDELQVIGAPCNQFGSEENFRDGEILAALEHVRPGNGFKPKFPMLKRLEVNGAKTSPLFKFLKDAIWMPSDDDPCVIAPEVNYIDWSPVCRNDISWNFAKFLIDRSGRVFQRYSPNFEPKNIAKDIAKLLA